MAKNKKKSKDFHFRIAKTATSCRLWWSILSFFREDFLYRPSCPHFLNFLSWLILRKRNKMKEILSFGPKIYVEKLFSPIPLDLHLKGPTAYLACVQSYPLFLHLFDSLVSESRLIEISLQKRLEKSSIKVWKLSFIQDKKCGNFCSIFLKIEIIRINIKSKGWKREHRAWCLALLGEEH